MVICLKQGADCLHIVQLMTLHPKTPSSLASFKSRQVLSFRYRLTQVVLEKRPLNGCLCVRSPLSRHRIQPVDRSSSALCRIVRPLLNSVSRQEFTVWSMVWGSPQEQEFTVWSMVWGLHMSRSSQCGQWSGGLHTSRSSQCGPWSGGLHTSRSSQCGPWSGGSPHEQ